MWVTQELRYCVSLIQNNVSKTVACKKLEPTHRIVFFSNLDYEKLLSNTIQSNSIELRTETGQLVPFSGTSKVILSLQFKKFSD